MGEKLYNHLSSEDVLSSSTSLFNNVMAEILVKYSHRKKTQKISYNW